MLGEPFLGALVSRTGLGYVLPIPCRMVHLTGVHQLVDNEVVADEFRDLDEPPVQRDGASGGA